MQLTLIPKISESVQESCIESVRWMFMIKTYIKIELYQCISSFFFFVWSKMDSSDWIHRKNKILEILPLHQID